jgi:multiple sugar transport system substrate-binding protein
MMIGPNQISSYVASTENPINFGIASIPANEGKATSSVGVMDRFMCFAEDGRSEAEMDAIKTVMDAFYEDESYAEWVIMEDFLPATTSGGEIMAAADPAAGAWIEIVGSANFYPAAKAEWADVKQGVISVEQNCLLGGNAQELLDALQAQIAG